jgi:hypothetical protein
MPPGRSAANPSWFVRTSTSALPCAGPFFLLHAAGEQEEMTARKWDSRVQAGCSARTWDEQRSVTTAALLLLAGCTQSQGLCWRNHPFNA